MRLIDADAFIQMMEEKCDPESTLDPWVLSVCRGGVKMMPTVDAISVVRCRDCKHNPKYTWFECPMVNLTEKQRPETAWCWKGERKDGDGNG